MLIEFADVNVTVVGFGTAPAATDGTGVAAPAAAAATADAQQIRVGGGGKAHRGDWWAERRSPGVRPHIPPPPLPPCARRRARMRRGDRCHPSLTAAAEWRRTAPRAQRTDREGVGGSVPVYAKVVAAECAGFPEAPVFTQPWTCTVVAAVMAGTAVVATFVPVVHEAPSAAQAAALPSVV